MASRSEVKPSGGNNRRSHSGDERPLMRFFKIILPCILEDKKLRIPTKFMRQFGEELSEVAKVTVPSGHTWKIGLTRDHNNIWFDKGWQNFVEHHSIGFWHLLLFTYRGCSNFSVLIFGKSACEIQYPCGPASAKETNYGEKCLFNHGVEKQGKGESSKRHYASAQQNVEMKRSRRYAAVQESRASKHFSDRRSGKSVTEEDPEIIDLEDAAESRKGKLNKHCMSRSCPSLFNETKDKDKTKLLSKGEDVGIFAGIPPRAPPQSGRVTRPAKMLKPKNPSFMVTLQQYNIHNNFLYVPLGFSKRLIMLGASGLVKLQMSNGRAWPVRILRNGNRRRHVTLTKGWSQFIGDNNLVEGDVCTFELGKDNSLVLKVTISRDGKAFKMSCR